MRAFNNVWRTVVPLIAVLGLLVAGLRLGIFGALTLFLSTGALIGAATAALRRVDDPATWRELAWPGALGGTVALATIGMTVLVGPGAVLILLACALSSPRALAWFRHRRNRSLHNLPRSESPAPPDTVDPAAVTRAALHRADGDGSTPESMSDAAICRAWRRSYLLLQRAGSVTARMVVVQQRQRYLDELERRNPTGLSGWLASGARAAGDPSRYIVPPADSGHPPAA